MTATRGSSSRTNHRARRSWRRKCRRRALSPRSTPYRARCFSPSLKIEAAALRPSLAYCGDNAKAKDVAAQLIRDVGFDPVDAGPLRIARYTEPFALLIGQLAYEGDRGPALAYRFDWFEERNA